LKHGFVYIWRDRKHKRHYIGVHWGREDDGYVCSSSWMTQAYKRRPADFKRKILRRVDTKEELFKEEARWLSMIQTSELKTKYYNLNINLKHWRTGEDAETMREKISRTTREAMAKPVTRQKFLDSRKQMSSTIRKTLAIKYADVRTARVHIKRRGKRGTLSHRIAMSSDVKAMWKTEEYRNKQLSSRKGLRWWTDGATNTRSTSPPSKEWRLGRTKQSKRDTEIY